MLVQLEQLNGVKKLHLWLVTYFLKDQLKPTYFFKNVEPKSTIQTVFDMDGGIIHTK